MEPRQRNPTAVLHPCVCVAVWLCGCLCVCVCLPLSLQKKYLVWSKGARLHRFKAKLQAAMTHLGLVRFASQLSENDLVWRQPSMTDAQAVARVREQRAATAAAAAAEATAAAAESAPSMPQHARPVAITVGAAAGGGTPSSGASRTGSAPRARSASRGGARRTRDADRPQADQVCLDVYVCGQGSVVSHCVPVCVPGCRRRPRTTCCWTTTDSATRRRLIVNHHPHWARYAASHATSGIAPC